MLNLYPNNLKNWEFGEEAPQNSHLERANIVGVQGASEDENFEEKPTLPKTNSSSCLGIFKKGAFEWIFNVSEYKALLLQSPEQPDQPQQTDQQYNPSIS